MALDSPLFEFGRVYYIKRSIVIVDSKQNCNAINCYFPHLDSIIQSIYFLIHVKYN